MKMFKPLPDQSPNAEARFKDTVCRFSETGTIGATYLCVALQLVLWIGILFTEGVPNMRPNIPDPKGTAVASMPVEPASPPMKRLTKTVILYVQPVDLQRLARTITQDVARHGGHITKQDQNGRSWTFVVPERYLDRMEPLITSSEVHPPRAEYQNWAKMVSEQPHDPNINGTADTAVSLRLGIPIISNPTTKKLALWTAIPSVVAFLTLPLMMIAHRLAYDS